MIQNHLPGILAQNNISIRELSQRIGVTYSMVYDAVNQRRRSIRFEVLEAICAELNIQPGNVYTYTPGTVPTNE